MSKEKTTIKYEGAVIEIDSDRLIRAESDDMGGGYSCVKHYDDFYIVYEDIVGHLINIILTKNYENNTFEAKKEVLLYTKSRKFSDKTINAYFRNNRLYVLFSAVYKNMYVIYSYSKSDGVLVFDVTDRHDFISIQNDNQNIIVVYQKNRKIGYSAVLSSGYTDFKPIDGVKAPRKLYNFNNDIYLLSYEDGYVLTTLELNKKYRLPLVFGQKPEIYSKDDIIYLKYLYKGRREITYIIKESNISFFSEKIY